MNIATVGGIGAGVLAGGALAAYAMTRPGEGPACEAYAGGKVTAATSDGPAADGTLCRWGDPNDSREGARPFLTTAAAATFVVGATTLVGGPPLRPLAAGLLALGATAGIAVGADAIASANGVRLLPAAGVKFDTVGREVPPPR